MPNTLEWFKARIGKRVYRDARKDHEKECKDCAEVAENGVLIEDEESAEYLHMISHDLQFDYRDEK